MFPIFMGFKTDAIHAGQEPDPTTGAVTIPIYQTSTYVQEGMGKHKGFEYARTQNPTRMALEKNMAVLERGVAGYAFASGMAATTALTQLLLKQGDHAICSENVYGGTFRLFDKIVRHYGVDFTYVNTSDLADVEKAMRPNTQMVFIETPTNPIMSITDIRAVADIAHRQNCRVVVDNTFMSPYFQRPIELGADIVVHSTTKYLNGHSDSVGGVAVLKRQGRRGPAAVHSERRRSDSVAVRFVARAARNQDSAGPNGSAQCKRHGHCEIPGRPERHREDLLSRTRRIILDMRSRKSR